MKSHTYVFQTNKQFVILVKNNLSIEEKSYPNLPGPVW